MTTPEVGIFGAPDDPQVASVAGALRERGAEVRNFRLGAAEMAGWRWSTDRIERRDGSVLDDLVSVYVRSVPTIVPRHDQAVVGREEQAGWIAAAERGRRFHGAARAAQRSLERRGVAMVNPADCFWFHRSKPAADQRLHGAGVAVPSGLVSSDAEEVKGFADEVGEVVYKPVAGGGACRALDPAELEDPETRRRLSRSPVLFQERVRGRDLRLYTVDGEVAGACVIHTDALDYRGNETGLEAIEPSPELAELAGRAAEALGMVFAGIDIKDPGTGELTVLDVNPSPMFAGIEQATGIDVAGPLADRLIRGGSR